MKFSMFELIINIIPWAISLFSTVTALIISLSDRHKNIKYQNQSREFEIYTSFLAACMSAAKNGLQKDWDDWFKFCKTYYEVLVIADDETKDYCMSVFDDLVNGASKQQTLDDYQLCVDKIRKNIDILRSKNHKSLLRKAFSILLIKYCVAFRR